MDGEGVDELVAQQAAHDAGGERGTPALDFLVRDGGGESGVQRRSEVGHVARQPPAPRAGLDDVEPLGASQQPPHLFKLHRDQGAKGRMRVRAGKEIPRRADAGRLTANDVVPAGPIQRKLHEFGEGNPPLRLDRSPYGALRSTLVHSTRSIQAPWQN